MKRARWTLLAVLAAALTLSGALPRPAATPQTAAFPAGSPWSPVALDAGDVTGLATAGINIEFAVASGMNQVPRLYKSVDAGDSWTEVGRIGTSTGRSGLLAISPADPGAMVTSGEATGLRVSSDGGATWSAPLTGGGMVATFDPVQANVIYGTGSYYDPIARAAGPSFHKSTNGGATWTVKRLATSTTGVAGRRIAVSKAAPGLIYILAGRDPQNPTESRLYRSRNYGATWAEITGSIGRATKIYDISADAVRTGRVYVATANGVYRSGDQGTTWLGPKGLPCQGIAADKQQSDFVYAAGPGLVQWSRDGGRTWASRSLKFDRVNVVASLNGSHIYVGTSAGVQRSLDVGASWYTKNTGLRARTISRVAVSRSNPAVVYAKVADEGLYRSDDGGLSWKRLSNGPWASIRTRDLDALVVDPSNPEIVYAFLSYTAVYRSGNGGRTWTTFVSGVIEDFALDEADPRRMAVAFGRPYPKAPLAHVTRDGGATWTVRSVPVLYSEEALSLAFGPSPVVYAGGWYADDDGPPMRLGQISRSANQGGTWTRMDQVFTRQVSVPAGKALRLYARRCDDGQSFYDYLGRSVDGGATWSKLPDIGALDYRLSSGLLDEILCASPLGVFYWSDGASAWTPVNTGLSGQMDGIAWHPASGLAFTWTKTGGFYRNTGLAAAR